MSALPADADDAETRAEIRAQVRAAGTSFYWAMRLLPAERRELLTAFYTGATVTSLAERSARSEPTVRQLLHRLRERLRDCVLRRLATEAS